VLGPVFQAWPPLRPAPAPPYDAGVGAELVTGLPGEVGLPVPLADRVVVECAAAVLGSIGAAASLLWEERTGEAQPVTVARLHAGASLVGFALRRLEVPTSPIGTHAPAWQEATAGI
jgi:crotonobetainyl-CoA:carnitine CoA-transferase CaiB-like acyl-CoA transferase